MSIVFSILRNFPFTKIGDVEYLGGAGGFSGAQIWKVQASETTYCLRRWPLPHPNPDRLEWINRVLVHVSNSGCPAVATPIETVGGERFVRQNGFLWECAPWMKGQASFHQAPSAAKLQNAMNCLAQFHLASAQVNLDFRNSDTAAARHQMLTEADALINQIRRSKAPRHLPSLGRLRDWMVARGQQSASDAASLIQPLIDEVLPVQPVIRDIWHDHLLFTGDEVTGIVDFGAMQIDNVAVDLSRLLGSLIGSDAIGWQKAIAHYGQQRSLSSLEIQFAFALNQCANLLSSLNWLKWILLERRQFESWDNVDRRIRKLLEGLSNPDQGFARLASNRRIESPPNGANGD